MGQRRDEGWEGGQFWERRGGKRTVGIEGERKSGINRWERKGCGNGNYREDIKSAWKHR